MGQTIDLNRKANIRQKTAADLISSSGLPVIAEYTADSVAGQTLIPASGTLSFAIDTSTPENLWLFVDGKRLRFGASNDFTFAQIDGSGFSSVIQLNNPLAANLSIVASKLGIKKEAEFQVDARLSQIYDMSTAAFQGMVDESSKLAAVNGAPSTGQFRTFAIQNRASIPDIQNDLRARMGIDRVIIQNIAEVQNEFGPNGEKVFSVVNDDRNLIRFVGDWIASINNGDLGGGAHIDSFDVSIANEYIEIVFFGTGLNVVYFADNNSRDLRVTVDGGAEGANIIPNTSTALSNRNYPSNTIVAAASGLTLGLHTVKLRDGSITARGKFYGFEIVNESANVNVRPGVAYVGGKKLILSAASNVAYNSGTFDSVLKDGATATFSTVRGARVLEYIKSDGSKGKSAILTNSAQANLVSADHTNEDLMRTHYWREFSANRTDDIGAVAFGGVGTNLAFTLDDGTTTLVGNSVRTNNASGAQNEAGLQLPTNTGYIQLTFVGTGLDVMRTDDSNGGSDTYSVLVDGINVGNMNTTGQQLMRREKIVSGLPYGTHVVRITRVSVATYTLGIRQFIVYGPKKPTLPAGAVELCDYNIMADYSSTNVTGTTTTDWGQMPSGVLFKANTREMQYVGSGWNAPFSVNTVGPAGFDAGNNTSSQPVNYVFFGTGFMTYNSGSGAGTYDFTVTIDGVLNAAGVAKTNASNLGGGSYRQTNAATGTPGRVEFTGLTLGIHTVSIARTAGAGNYSFNGLSIITPIHAPKSQLPGDFQNTLPIGSCGISDNRKLSLIKSESPAKFRGQALGVTSSPTTTSTVFVPLPEMSLTVPSRNGAWFELLFSGDISATSGSSQLAFFVDGAQVGPNMIVNATNNIMTGAPLLVFLAPGVHKVDVYWLSASTNTANLVSRTLTVKEL